MQSISPNAATPLFLSTTPLLVKIKNITWPECQFVAQTSIYIYIYIWTDTPDHFTPLRTCAARGKNSYFIDLSIIMSVYTSPAGSVVE